MSKHTPGPWEVRYEYNVFAGKRSVASAGGYASNGPDELAIVEENKANARLIAAAPAMYEALVELWEAGEWVWDEFDDATIFSIKLSKADQERLFIEIGRSLTS